MRKRELRERLREECEVVKRLEHQHYLDGMALQQIVDRQHIPPCDETVWDYCTCLDDIAERALEGGGTRPRPSGVGK